MDKEIFDKNLEKKTKITKPRKKQIKKNNSNFETKNNEN